MVCCHHCGTHISRVCRFCDTCGTPLTAQQSMFLLVMDVLFFFVFITGIRFDRENLFTGMAHTGNPWKMPIDVIEINIKREGSEQTAERGRKNVPGVFVCSCNCFLVFSLQTMNTSGKRWMTWERGKDNLFYWNTEKHHRKATVSCPSPMRYFQPHVTHHHVFALSQEPNAMNEDGPFQDGPPDLDRMTMPNGVSPQCPSACLWCLCIETICSNTSIRFIQPAPFQRRRALFIFFMSN